MISPAAPVRPCVTANEMASQHLLLQKCAAFRSKERRVFLKTSLAISFPLGAGEELGVFCWLKPTTAQTFQFSEASPSHEEGTAWVGEGRETAGQVVWDAFYEIARPV